MTKTVQVSSKGQIVIPAEVRRELDIDRNTKLEVEVEEGTIRLRPVREGEWMKLRGFLAGGTSLTAELEKERQKERERDHVRLGLLGDSGVDAE